MNPNTYLSWSNIAIWSNYTFTVICSEFPPVWTLSLFYFFIFFLFKESATTHVQAGPYDRYVLAKHSEVYPPTEELEAVQTIVSHVECALKTVSDQMDAPKDDEANTEAQR